MQVHSINNVKLSSFGNEKAVDKKDASVVSSNEIDKKETLKEDKFQQQAQAPKNELMPGVPMPSVAQISKMQTVQKALGGLTLAIGALGILSTFSSKKWVRGLFTIPVGGVIALFGANMIRVAGAFDKLKDASNSQARQQ